MINVKHLAAVVGFLFVAMWIITNFGYAVLCLVGAAIFHAVASFMQGELDVGEIQSRLGVGGPRPTVCLSGRGALAGRPLVLITRL